MNFWIGFFVGVTFTSLIVLAIIAYAVKVAKED